MIMITMTIIFYRNLHTYVINIKKLEERRKNKTV